MAKFNAYEKRVLGLYGSPEEELSDQSAEALRNIIDAFPWMLSVADCNYDSKVAQASVAAHAGIMQLQMAVEDYHIREAASSPHPDQDLG